MDGVVWSDTGTTGSNFAERTAAGAASLAGATAGCG